MAKRKVAVLLGYNGFGFRGMQFNGTENTIEKKLFDALHAVGCVTDANFEDPHKISLARACRTDKNVSAAFQVVSAKLVVSEDSVKRLNELLNPEIIVYGIVKTTKGFNAHLHCTSRVYRYALPGWMLKPLTRAELRRLYAAATPEAAAELSFEDKGYAASISEVNDMLSAIKGTHDFKNFTSITVRSATGTVRTVHKCEVSREFFVDGVQWLELEILGQGFMLHQIRKLFALCVLWRRLSLDDPFAEAYRRDRMNIPKLPGHTLVLVRPAFKSYNTRNPGKEVRFLDFAEQIDAFMAYLRERTVEIEKRERLFDGYLRTIALNAHRLDYVKTRGRRPLLWGVVVFTVCGVLLRLVAGCVRGEVVVKEAVRRLRERPVELCVALIVLLVVFCVTRKIRGMCCSRRKFHRNTFSN